MTQRTHDTGPLERCSRGYCPSTTLYARPMRVNVPAVVGAGLGAAGTRPLCRLGVAAISAHAELGGLGARPLLLGGCAVRLFHKVDLHARFHRQHTTVLNHFAPDGLWAMRPNDTQHRAQRVLNPRPLSGANASSHPAAFSPAETACSPAPQTCASTSRPPRPTNGWNQWTSATPLSGSCGRSPPA